MCFSDENLQTAFEGLFPIGGKTKGVFLMLMQPAVLSGDGGFQEENKSKI